MSMLTVGVDISYKTFEAASSLGQAKPGKLGHYRNDADGFNGLAQAVAQAAQAGGAETIHLILEPTGGYEQPLARFALERGWRVSLPNPRQVRDWAKGSGQRAKSDRQDALMLTAYGCQQQPPEWRPLPEPVAELEALLLRRDDLEQMLQQEENRRHALQARQADQGPVAQSLAQSMAYLQQAISQIEQEIQAHLKQHPDLKQQAKQLRTVPGVGPRNVLPILVLLHRWGVLTQFQGSGQGLTAYVGLDPVPYESGSSVYRPAGISRQGNPQLRRQLFMGAFGGIRGDNPLRAFYQHLVARGKRKRLALVAAARKLLTWAWAVFRTQTDFDPAKAAPAQPMPMPAAS
jgi:transposase